MCCNCNNNQGNDALTMAFAGIFLMPIVISFIYLISKIAFWI